MSNSQWTKEDLREFKKLVDMSGSRNQMMRIEARIQMPKFIEKHGQEKCDAMWAHINKEQA